MIARIGKRLGAGARRRGSSHDQEPSGEMVRRMLTRKTSQNPGCADVREIAFTDQPGLTVFFLNTQAEDLTQLVISRIRSLGFEVLETISLDGPRAESAAELIERLGVRVPHAFGEAGVLSVFVALDVFPNAVPDEILRTHPRLDNARTYQALFYANRDLRTHAASNRRQVSLQSTQSSADAWAFVQAYAPSQRREIESIAADRRAAAITKFEVLRSVSRFSRRAKLEVIRYGSGLAVKKTFRHQSLHILEREASFLEDISPLRPEVLPVIERGPNYFICPFVNSRPTRWSVLGVSGPKLLALRQVRQVSDFLKFLFERGYDPVDCGPHNLLIDDSGNVKVIDFEFVHRTDAPVEAEESLCLSGVHESFEGEVPKLAAWLHDPYFGYWYGHTGLGLRSFLHDPAWLQMIKRAVNYPTFILANAFRRTLRINPRQSSGVASAQQRRAGSPAANGPGAPRPTAKTHAQS